MDLLIGCRVKYGTSNTRSSVAIIVKCDAQPTRDCLWLLLDDGEIISKKISDCWIHKNDMDKIRNKSKELRNSIRSRFEMMDI